MATPRESGLKTTINDMSIDVLPLKTRSKNCLYRADIYTIDRLMETPLENLRNIRSLGLSSYEDILKVVEKYKQNPTFYLENDMAPTPPQKLASVSDLSPEDRVFPINEIQMTKRLFHAMVRNGIFTLGEMLKVDKDELARFHGVGLKTMNDFDDLRNKIALHGVDALKTKEAIAFLPGESRETRKGFDYDLIDLMIKDYHLKKVTLAEWFQVSRQRIDQLLKNRPYARYQRWDKKRYTPTDGEAVRLMCEDRTFNVDIKGRSYHLFNNRYGNLLVVEVGKTIRALWFADFPADLQKKMKELGMCFYEESGIRHKGCLYLVKISGMHDGVSNVSYE